MRLFLATASAVFVMCLFGDAVGQNRQPDTAATADQKQNTANPKNDVSMSTAQTLGNRESRKQEEAAHQATQNGLLPSPEWVSAISAVAIVLLTLAYVCVSRQMLKQVREQVVIAKDAAIAAKKSADALINGERAWLLIDGIEAPPDFAESAVPCFTYRVVNFGKTPGFMIAGKGYVQLVDNRDTLEDLTFREIGGGKGEEAVVLPKGELLRLIDDEFPIDQSERDKIFAIPPELYLWVCGSIHYHDVFGQIRTTPFAYWYSVGEHKFVRSNWPDLNKPK